MIGALNIGIDYGFGDDDGGEEETIPMYEADNGYDSDPDAIWIFPEDSPKPGSNNNRSKPSSAEMKTAARSAQSSTGAAKAATSATSTNSGPAPEVVGRMRHLLGNIEASRPSASKHQQAERSHQPLSPEEFLDLQELAIFYNTILTTSDAYRSLTLNSQGVTVQTVNPQTSKLDIVFLKGITETLREQFYPDAKFYKRQSGVRDIRGMLKLRDEDDGSSGDGAEEVAVGISTPKRRNKQKGPVGNSISDATNTYDYLDQLWAQRDQAFGGYTHSNPVSYGHHSSRPQQQQQHRPTQPPASVTTERVAPTPKLSFTAIRHGAMRRGSDSHKKLEVYNKAYIHTIKTKHGRIDKVLKNYHRQLEFEGIMDGASPDVTTVLSVYAHPDYQFIPVAAELPVYNTSQTNRYFKERQKRSAAMRNSHAPSMFRGVNNSDPFYNSQRQRELDRANELGGLNNSKFRVFGTLIDALVLAPHLNNSLAILEFTFTTGDFLKSSGPMKAPLQFLSNSGQNRKLVQITLTIYYFKKTYFHLIKDVLPPHIAHSEEIHGYIICTSPAGGDVIIKHVTPAEQAVVLNSLKATGFMLN